MPYTLSLFGTIDLNDPAGKPCAEVLSQPKRAALLAYLAAAKPFGYQRRDRLLAVFWPESNQGSARRSLNQSVHFLRRHLGADCVTSRGGDEVGLAAASIECDTVAFQDALDRDDWADALSLYRGDLLDGFFVSDLPEFEEWLGGAHAGYRDEAIRAAWALSHASFGRHQMDEAKRWARWAAAKTPYDESSFRRYMELLGRAGDRATAVQAYSEFTLRLKSELEISPSPETSELAAAIRDRVASLESNVEMVSIVRDAGAVADDGPRDSELPLHGGLRATDRVGMPGGPAVPRALPSARVVTTAELWSRIAGIGAAAAVTLGVAYLAVMRFGLPDWLFAGAAILVGAGFLVLVATALTEHRRAPAVVHANVSSGGIYEWLSWRRAIRVGVVAWLGLGLTGVGYAASRMLGIGPAATLFTKGVLENRDEILIAEFENNTGDSLLGHAMTEALRIDLSQSRAVRLVDPDRVASTLQLMSMEPASFLDGDLARGVAQRLGVKAVLSGDITPVGTGYSLSVSLLSSGDGSVLWADRDRAASVDALIETIGQLSRGARAEIGESLRDVRATPPLEDVTTTSVEALKAFSEGKRIKTSRNQRDAIPFFTRAIAVDSAFALAHQQIARVLANTGGSLTRQAEAIEKAFQLRQRTTEIERLLIESTYFALTGDGERALSAWRLLNRLQPENWSWWNNVGNRVAGNLPARFPDHDEGIAFLNRAFELCECAFPLGNYTKSLLIAGMVDSAQALIDLYSETFPEMPAWQQLRGALAYAVGDLPLAVRELEANRPLLRDLSAVLAVQGRLSASREVFQRWAVTRGADGPATTYLGVLAYQESVEVVLGRSTDGAVGRVEEALRMLPIDSIEPLDRPYVQVAEFLVRAGRVEQAATLMNEFEATVEPRWRRLAEWRRLLVRGLIEQEQLGAEQALPTFERAVQEANAHLAPVPDFGFALDRAGAKDSAIAVFQRFIGPSPRYAAWSFDAMWRAAVLKRLGELYEERGDRDAALGYYQQFVEQWSKADPELQLQVEDVRRRMARLTVEAASAGPDS